MPLPNLNSRVRCQWWVNQACAAAMLPGRLNRTLSVLLLRVIDLSTRSRDKNSATKQALCLMLLVAGVTGCAIPAGVDPLPIYNSDGSSQIYTPMICDLYGKYHFMDDSCDVIALTHEQLTSDEFKAARNEVQNTLLGLATIECNRLKKRLAGRSRGQLQGAESVALLLSAGASAGTGDAVTSLSAGATALTGAGRLLEEKHTTHLQTVVLGIEIARTDVFMNILESQDSDLLEYPLARAVNDAMRYHGVCNFETGLSTSSRALSTALEQSGGG